MDIIIVIIGIIGFIIYKFLHNRDKMLQKQVDIYGGMAKKYKYLIENMIKDTDFKIVRVKRDQIHMFNGVTGGIAATNVIIAEDFGTVVITVVVQWAGRIGMKKKWRFPHNYSQEKMFQEIDDYGLEIVEFIERKFNQ
jgi:hypothetical protein